jgi:hypothetical protein
MVPRLTQDPDMLRTQLVTAKMLPLSKQSVPQIDDKVWVTNMGYCKSGITLAGDLYHQIANCFREPTCVLAYSTVALVGVTFYYAIQTRTLTKNQFLSA